MHLTKPQIFGFVSIAIVTILVLLSIIFVSGPSPGIKVQVGLGQTFVIQSSEISITLKEVLEDSRCPTNVVCVWEGRAILALDVTIEDQEYSTTLSSSEPTILGNYSFTLHDLKPHPVSTDSIDPSEYIAELIVSKNK